MRIRCSNIVITWLLTIWECASRTRNSETTVPKTKQQVVHAQLTILINICLSLDFSAALVQTHASYHSQRPPCHKVHCFYKVHVTGSTAVQRSRTCVYKSTHTLPLLVLKRQHNDITEWGTHFICCTLTSEGGHLGSSTSIQLQYASQTNSLAKMSQFVLMEDASFQFGKTAFFLSETLTRCTAHGKALTKGAQLPVGPCECAHLQQIFCDGYKCTVVLRMCIMWSHSRLSQINSHIVPY